MGEQRDLWQEGEKERSEKERKKKQRRKRKKEIIKVMN